MALNPWQQLLLGQGYSDPQQQYALPPQQDTTQDAPQDVPQGAPVSGVVPGQSPAPSPSGDGGGAAAAPQAGILGAVAAPMLQQAAGQAQQADPLAADRRQALWSSLAQLGPILLAAGQRMTPAQRAQILSQAGGALDLNKNMLSATQTRLLQQKLSTEQVAAQRQQMALGSLLRDPTIPLSVKQLALQDPGQALKLWAERQNPTPTDFTQKAAYLKSIGKSPEEIAQTLLESDGKFTTTANPLGGYLVTDARTGKVQQYGQDNTALFGALGIGAPGQAGQGQAPAPAPQQAQGNPPAPASSQYAPPQTNAGYGPGAWVTEHITGPAMSLFGQDKNMRPEAKDTMSTVTQLGALNNEITGALSTDVEGRVSQAERDNVRALLPDPAALGQGPTVALQAYKGVIPRIDAKIAQVQREGALAIQVQDKGRIQNAVSQYQQLQGLRQRIGQTVEALGVNQQGQPYLPQAAAARGVLGQGQGQPQGQPNDAISAARAILNRGQR